MNEKSVERGVRQWGLVVAQMSDGEGAGWTE